MYGKEPVKDSIIYNINPDCIECNEIEKDNKRDYYSISGFSNRTIDKKGVPLWDDFVSHYKDKNFNDSFDLPPYTHSLDDKNITLDNALNPSKPKINIWENKTSEEKEKISMFSQEKIDNGKIIYTDDLSEESFCPFETEFECKAWKIKPQINEIVTPKNPKIKQSKMNKILLAIKENKELETENIIFEPLLERYKILMRSARSCCTEGMIYKLKKAGASTKLVYKFLSDDANFYDIGNRCLMMTDQDLDKRFSNTETSNVIADVRNSCLCKGRDWFKSILEPFVEIYKQNPNFKNSQFLYYYNDGLNRNITVSINEDINNIINQLKSCP